MDRRSFLTSLFGVAGAAAAVLLLPTSARALPLFDPNDLGDNAVHTLDGSSGEEPEAYIQEAQYYRRRRRSRGRGYFYRRPYRGQRYRYRYRYRRRCYVTRNRWGRRIRVCR